MRKNNLYEYSTSELVALKLADLPIAISRSANIKEGIHKLLTELQKKELLVVPSFWLSTEWFSPDNYLGIAIPFYLAHPLLTDLEKSHIGYLEGEGDSFLKLLRHEMGHVIDNAFMLRKNREWQSYFGRSSLPYPQYYDFRPYSKSYVQHLGDGYAQVHPVEDFAETFAVWLDPQSRWRSKYYGRPVYEKLQYVDRLMKSLKNKRPLIQDKDEIEPLGELDFTLGEYYRKRRRYLNSKDRFWRDLPFIKLERESRERLRSLISGKYLVPKYKADRLISSYLRGTKQSASPSKRITSMAIERILVQKAAAFFQEKRDHQPL